MLVSPGGARNYPVTDYVVDTNVWVTVDKNLADVTTLAELDCIESCRAWLAQFQNHRDRLVVDLTYEILREYRQNIRSGGRAVQLFSQLETQPRERLVEVEIAFDEDGFARVPEALAIADKSDRKFISVALVHTPTPPIINATDTDWAKDQDLLARGGITVNELCPGYIHEKLKG